MKKRYITLVVLFVISAFAVGYVAARWQDYAGMSVLLFVCILLTSAYMANRLIDKRIKEPLQQITTAAQQIVNDGAYQEFRVNDETFFQDLVVDLNELQYFYQANFQEVMEKVIVNEENYLQMIFMINKAVEAKDLHTYKHADKVAGYAEKIVNFMGLSQEQKEKIIYAAMLHDVGKIGISESILSKPDRLTDDEYDKIKTHSAMGRDILQNSSSLWDLLPYIYHHHEHFNGNGYPEGLSGDDIPLGARIIAVADAYDAMTSNRPYRKAMSIEKACQILVEEKNKQFDGEVVDALLEVLGMAGLLKRRSVSSAVG